jgi:hypothetical protein
MQEMRDVEFPNCGAILKPTTLAKVMLVPLHEALGPNVAAVELGVPVPVIVMPIPDGTVMPLAHVVGEHGGMMMMSPSTAVCVGPLITALTLAWLQLAAVKVPAFKLCR